MALLLRPPSLRGWPSLHEGVGGQKGRANVSNGGGNRAGGAPCGGGGQACRNWHAWHRWQPCLPLSRSGTFRPGALAPPPCAAPASSPLPRAALHTGVTLSDRQPDQPRDATRHTRATRRRVRVGRRWLGLSGGRRPLPWRRALLRTSSTRRSPAWLPTSTTAMKTIRPWSARGTLAGPVHPPAPARPCTDPDRSIGRQTRAA